jgi:hypothetical protein
VKGIVGKVSALKLVKRKEFKERKEKFKVNGQLLMTWDC